MKSLITGIVLISLFSQVGKAQYQYIPLSQEYLAKTSVGRNNLSLHEIQGSPYLDKEFKAGTVLTKEDVLYKDIPLRYNCYNDVLEFNKNNISYDLMPKATVKRAEFGGKVFVCKDFESKDGTGKSYFEMLVEGKASILVHYSIKFYEPEPLKAYSEAKSARFDDLEKDFYITIMNSQVGKISNQRKLLEILADKQKEIESFISKEKLSVKKEDDLKKIAVYYNSL